VKFNDFIVHWIERTGGSGVSPIDEGLKKVPFCFIFDLLSRLVYRWSGIKEK